MDYRPTESSTRVALSRRGLLAASVAGGLTLRLGVWPALAQESAIELPVEAAPWLKYNLDTASTEQLMGIPGAGDRMTRELEEYRPYTSIGQYRAEIGKYIPPEEVAALETYLFVPVDPNEANADTLQQLPGVSSEVAEALIAGRPYDSADAFLAALGEQAASDLVTAAATFLAPDAGDTATWVKYNLNTATSEQFLGIPGAGERMTREFEEYRPYTTIGQYRAEIGKYISPEEVAVLERYLFIPVAPTQTDLDTVQQLPGVNADIAQALVSAGPFDSVDAFLSALGALVAPELAAVAAAYVDQP